MVYLDQRVAEQEARDKQLPTEAAHSHMPLWRAIAGFAIAALTVLAAGPYLAEAAGKIAELSGLGNTFVGTTLVALCTSLPELAASYAAIRIGAHDLAIGNVFGSNAFNMLLFLPLDLAFPGSLFAAVSPAHAVSIFAAIVATSVVIMGQLYSVESRTRLLEPDAIIVIAIILAGLAIVYYAR
jgi:cation:H+ antiporter